MGLTYLIGMPGSGKSTFGALAAKALGMVFLDTDELIEASEGKTTAEIFQAHGENHFRDLETECLRRLIYGDGGWPNGKREGVSRGRLVAVGGGLPIREENRRLMRASGLVILIDRRPEDIAVDVLFGADRPLLPDAGALHKLYESRQGFYEETAHRIVRNNQGFESVSEEITAAIALRGGIWACAVIGDPVKQSLSPVLHRAAFEALGIDSDYGALRVQASGLEAAMSDMRAGVLKGLNVTIPHKVAVARHMDALHGDAVSSGAVNTVVNEDGMLIGHNTDMEGLLMAVRQRGKAYKNAHIAILGTGGAAIGIVHKAISEGAASVTVLGRDCVKRRTICEALTAPCGDAPGIRTREGDHDAQTQESGEGDHGVQTHINGDTPGIRAGEGARMRSGGTIVREMPFPGRIPAETDLLINATPLGMSGHGRDFEDLSFLELLPKSAMVVDLVYNPPETKLLAAARALGLETENGLSMLICQGILSEELFFGIRPDRGKLYQVAYRALMAKMAHAAK